ncbi:MAG: septation protein IspZ [Gammaproteobacteria bacterium]|nr:septation protein IspZ [Gammaproteobacteria bacterium]
MQNFIYEFLPIALFFGVYKYTGNIYDATLTLIIVSLLQVSYEYIKFKKVQKSRLIGTALILVLGGATVLFHDDLFIKWKVTVINWLFSLILFASYFIGKKTIIERMMGSVIELPKAVWSKLNAYWIAFFFISGLLNIYFAFYYGLDLPVEVRTDMWVNFKFYGLMGLTFVFMIAQIFIIQKYIPKEDIIQNQSSKENQ